MQPKADFQPATPLPQPLEPWDTGVCHHAQLPSGFENRIFCTRFNSDYVG